MCAQCWSVPAFVDALWDTQPLQPTWGPFIKEDGRRELTAGLTLRSFGNAYSGVRVFLFLFIIVRSAKNGLLVIHDLGFYLKSQIQMTLDAERNKIT